MNLVVLTDVDITSDEDISSTAQPTAIACSVFQALLQGAQSLQVISALAARQALTGFSQKLRLEVLLLLDFLITDSGASLHHARELPCVFGIGGDDALNKKVI